MVAGCHQCFYCQIYHHIQLIPGNCFQNLSPSIEASRRLLTGNLSGSIDTYRLTRPSPASATRVRTGPGIASSGLRIKRPKLLSRLNFLPIFLPSQGRTSATALSCHRRHRPEQPSENDVAAPDRPQLSWSIASSATSVGR